MRTGDYVKYISDVHGDYAGQDAKVEEFDLEQRMVSLEFNDGNIIWVFWNEIDIAT